MTQLNIQCSPTDLVPEIIFLHGGYSNPKQLIELGIQLDQFSKSFRIICPNLDNSFLNPTYSARLLNEILTKTSISIKNPGWICGNSMGGLGALSFFGRYPDLFQGVYSVCPALFSLTDHPTDVLKEYQSKTGIDKKLLRVLEPMLKAAFPEHKDFEAIDPFRIYDNLNLSSNKMIAFDCGNLDEFAFQMGCREFSNLLKRRSIQHEYFEIKGGTHDQSYLRAQSQAMLEWIIGQPNFDLRE